MNQLSSFKGYQENYIQKYYFLYIKTYSSVVIFGHSSAWRCDIYSQLLPSGIFNDISYVRFDILNIFNLSRLLWLEQLRFSLHLKMQHELVKYVIGVWAWLRREAINSEEASRYSCTSLDSRDLVENVL